MAEYRFVAQVTWHNPDSAWTMGSTIAFAQGQTPEHAGKRIREMYEKSGKQVDNVIIDSAEYFSAATSTV